MRRVNLETGAFGADSIDFRFGGWGAGDRIRPAADSAYRGLHLLLKAAEPGDYVVSAFVSNGYNMVSYIHRVHCMSHFGVVVHVEAGRVSVVRSNDVVPPGVPTRLTRTLDDATILRELEMARAAYPDLAGEAYLVKPRAAIRWTPTASGASVSACESAPNFEVLRRFNEGAPE
jgi:hypothetical protein